MALAQKTSARRLAAVWAAAALLCGAVLGAPAASDDDYADENRPYEFGFVIEGQQHRHEKKDERGIIMGEFGFITADGVYHVTVYATDENGDFKIISMKNIRLGPPLDQTRTAPRSSTTARPVTSPPAPSSTRAAIRLGGANGCSGCLIPTTTTSTAATPPPIGSELQPPFPAGPASVGAPGQSGAFGGGASSGGGFNGGAGASAGGGVRDRTGSGVADRTGGSFGGGAPGSAAGSPGSPVGGGTAGRFGAAAPGSAGGTGAGPLGGGSGGSVGGGAGGFGSVGGGGGGSVFGGQEAGRPGQPSVGSQPVGQRPAFGSTPSATPPLAPSGGQPGTAPPSPFGKAPASPFGGAVSPPGTRQQGGGQPAPFGQRPTPGVGGAGGGVQTPAGGVRPPPGEVAREGLPPGVTMQDVMDALLYRFNYTLPYHGHHEEGYRSGSKLGGYFADDRDGSGRSVKYLANEFGYQPNITLVDLRPQQAHTAEDERTAPLLGYKFEWLY